MDVNMKISIIIPVYNAYKYLEQCLNSAIAQTISPKEIICIDDGSTDRSDEILREYARKYNNIHCYTQKNQGAGAARNYGLQLAQGEFVAFMDADDFYMDQNALERMYLACTTHSVNICGSFRKILENGVLKDFELHRDLFVHGEEGVMISFQEYQDDLHYHNYIYRKNMLEQHGIEFPQYRRYQDPPFFLKSMVAAGSFWVCPVELYCLRLGHQDFAGYEKLIDQTLLGVRDNMKTASKYNYTILQKRLIERLEGEWFDRIVRNMDFQIAKLLVDIYESASEAGKEMQIFQRMRRYYIAHSSLRLYENLVHIKQKNIDLGKCLYQIGVEKIAIYGLGTFGEILYKELCHNDVDVVYGIDKIRKPFHDLDVISLEEDFPECDAIIITPMQSEGIAEELRKKTNVRLILFKDWIEEIRENMRKEIREDV